MQDHEEKTKTMEEALRTAGCRISTQRRAIIDYLASTSSHPSARQIFHEVEKRRPGLCLATVYNTLGVLAGLGAIKIMQFGATDNRYEPDAAPHINLICASCGGIKDLETEVPVLPEAIREKAGFEVWDSRLEYYGICAECRASGQEGRCRKTAVRNSRADKQPGGARRR